MDLDADQVFPPPRPIDPLLRAGQQRPRRPSLDWIALPGPSTPTPGLVSSDASPPRKARQRRMGRTDALVLVVASVLGVWFGAAAPTVSPVTPSAAKPAAAQTAAPAATLAVGGQG